MAPADSVKVFHSQLPNVDNVPKAHQLAAQFVKNFEQYEGMVPAEVLAAAPDPAGEEAPDFGAEG